MLATLKQIERMVNTMFAFIWAVMAILFMDILICPLLQIIFWIKYPDEV